MTKSRKEGHFKNSIILWILLSRSGIVLLAISMYIFNGLRPDELWPLLRLIAPLTSLYFVLFIKYTGQNANANIGGLVSGYFALGRNFLIGLNLTEIGVILCRSLFSVPTDESFYDVIALLEIILGAVAGTYILDLFGKKSN